MKKLTIWIILSSWMLYVLIPVIFKYVYGHYPMDLHSMGDFPEVFMTKAAIIITASFLISIFFIILIPVGETPVIDSVNRGKGYFYFAILTYMVLAVRAGILDYYNVVIGGANGTLFSYFSIFFQPVVLFLIVLYCVRDKGSIIVLAGTYLLNTLLSHSRSGALHLIIYLIGFALSKNILTFHKIKEKVKEQNHRFYKEVKVLVVLLAIAAPVLFIYSTISRGSITSNTSHSTVETVAARCSCLDEAGLVLYAIDNVDGGKEIFREKYSFVNQVECIIDSSIPGTIFNEEVNPNQYYRAVVGYMTEAEAAGSYSSVNIMFPIYLVIKYGYVFGLLLSINFIFFFYLLIMKLKDPVWQVIMVTIVLREILYYFDWVMIWKSFLRASLTIITFKIIVGLTSDTEIRIAPRKTVFRIGE